MLSQSNNKKQYIRHILNHLPRKPGVYKMKDADGNVIYVGKAGNLKNRVASYFNNDCNKSAKTSVMIKNISDIDYTVVNSELEALILETNLIKQLKPKYNVLMKDDKNYVYIKITVAEKYPRIYLVRKVTKDGAKYFGPKTAAHKVISTLKLLKSIFPYRNCELALDYGIHAENKYKNMTPAKLEYHRSHCLGPCITSVSPEEYRKTVNKVIDFFEGKEEKIIEQVRTDMLKAAAEKKFEQAASLRDKLKHLEEITKNQIVSDPSLSDLDIISYFIQDNKAYFVLFQVRSGKLISQENFIFQTGRDNSLTAQKPDILSAFLKQYYEKAANIAKEILLPHPTTEDKLLEEWISEIASKKVSIKTPERGKKSSLLELAAQNAQNFARLSEIKWQGAIKNDRLKALESLQKLLKLKDFPKRLECYDISHFQGSETVGSMVVFENGLPKKEDYRHFRLHQSKAGAPNDFASIAEILERRLKYLKPSIKANKINLKQANKKELKEFKTLPKLPNGKNFHYLVIKKEGKSLGQVSLEKTDQNKIIIKDIKYDPRLDLSTILNKTAEKFKVQRLYLTAPKNNIESFEEAGCQLIAKVPDWLNPQKNTTPLLYDKIKHKLDSSFSKIPSLIIIDGGKGQLSSATGMLKKHGLKIPIISIAKKNEDIYATNQHAPLDIDKQDPLQQMIQHIRDESHRFAITFHKKLRIKATTASLLDTIFGLGNETKIKLLRHFGSVEAIMNADANELAKVAGPRLATKIKKLSSSL